VLVGKRTGRLQYEYVRIVEVKFPEMENMPPKSVVFQFIWYSTRITKQQVLQIFDLDCCQVGYDGNKVFSTLSFVQSIATRTMINYKLVNDYFDLCTFLPRTIKYQKRGFKLLVPKKFDVSLLKREYEPRKQTPVSNSEKYGFLLNNDSLNVRETFVHLIDPKAPVLATYIPLPPIPNYLEDGFGSDDEAQEIVYPEEEEYFRYEGDEEDEEDEEDKLKRAEGVPRFKLE